MTELTPHQDDKSHYDRDDGSMLTMELRPRSPLGMRLGQNTFINALPEPNPSVVEEISEPSAPHPTTSSMGGKDIASIQNTLSSDTDGSSHFTSRSSSAIPPDLLGQGTPNTEPLHDDPPDAKPPANLVSGSSCICLTKSLTTIYSATSAKQSCLKSSALTQMGPALQLTTLVTYANLRAICKMP